jgi:hypothetical protein
MATFLIFLLIIAVIAGMFWILLGQLSPKRRGVRRPMSASAAVAKPGGLEKLRSSNFFWGVRIEHPGCPAAQKLQDRHYTFDEAPALPVPGCDSAHCTCQFKGLRERRSRDDQRTQEDRRDEIRFDMEHPERRSPKGRRRSEKWKDHTY